MFGWRIVVFCLLIAASPASARDCIKRGDRIAGLTEQGFTVAARGANHAGHMVELLQAQSSEWIIVETWPDGCTVVMNRGPFWARVTQSGGMAGFKPSRAE